MELKTHRGPVGRSRLEELILVVKGSGAYLIIIVAVPHTISSSRSDPEQMFGSCWTSS